jgi:hypothetical protein
MPGQLNQNPGSITSPRAGDRSHRGSRSPRDLTGKEYQRLHAENDAKKAAANLDINAIKRAEFGRGHEAGFDKGAESGWDTAIAFLERAGYISYDAETDTIHRLSDVEFDALPVADDEAE